MLQVQGPHIELHYEKCTLEASELVLREVLALLGNVLESLELLTIHC